MSTALAAYLVILLFVSIPSFVFNPASITSVKLFIWTPSDLREDVAVFVISNNTSSLWSANSLFNELNIEPLTWFSTFATSSRLNSYLLNAPEGPFKSGSRNPLFIALSVISLFNPNSPLEANFPAASAASPINLEVPTLLATETVPFTPLAIQPIGTKNPKACPVIAPALARPLVCPSIKSY